MNPYKYRAFSVLLFLLSSHAYLYLQRKNSLSERIIDVLQIQSASTY